MSRASSSSRLSKADELWDEKDFITPDQDRTPHVSAFKKPLWSDESETDSTRSIGSIESKRSSIEEGIDAIENYAHRALRKSSKALKRSSSSLLSFLAHREGSEWVNAKDGISDLGEDDANAVQQALDAANANCPDGKLYFRKVPETEGGEQYYWQVKFDHKHRSCFETAKTLEEAAKKAKSFLDYREPGELDDRFHNLSEYLNNDRRYNGAIILFKEGKSKDYYPWKVRVHHDKRGFAKRAESLEQAIRAMEEHVTFEEATPETQKGDVWNKIFSAMKKHRKMKVFFKEVTEDGPNEEQQMSCHVKVDHPIQGIQFEKKANTIDEAANDVLKYLEAKQKDKAANRKQKQD